MINSVTQGFQTYSFFVSSVKANTGDNSFKEITEKTQKKDILKSAPDKWVTEAGFSSDAVKAAYAFMKNELGIDPDKIEPTHELTPEQTAWLNSRHNFSTMQRYVSYTYVTSEGQTQRGVKATAEYSNFIGDLTYLGVYSGEDFVNMSVAPVDMRTGSYSCLTEYFDDTYNSHAGTILDTSREFSKYLERLFKFFDERSRNPLEAVDGDSDFAMLIRDRYLPLQKQFTELINKLLGNYDDNELSGRTAAPVIEDASKKLKEDFGGIFI